MNINHADRVCGIRIVTLYLFFLSLPLQRHSGSSSTPKPLSDKRPSYTDISMPGEAELLFSEL